LEQNGEPATETRQMQAVDRLQLMAAGQEVSPA
jgi:hypothetical protein